MCVLRGEMVKILVREEIFEGLEESLLWFGD